MPRELAACVERANLDPEVHVIALAGNGSGFCGGYDLVASAEGKMDGIADADAPPGSPVDPVVVAKNHNPEEVGPRFPDSQLMSPTVGGLISLFAPKKPVIPKAH